MTHRSFIIFLSVAVMLLIVGCSKRPKGVLSEGKMVQIIADIHIDEALQEDNTSRGKAVSIDDILKSHNVTRAEMDCTLSWYGHNMDKYAELYSKVDKELLKRKKRVMSSEDKERSDKGSEQMPDNLWAHSEKAILNDEGTGNALVLSLPNPGIKKGDIVEWKVRINSTTIPTISVLGAEYSDGTTNYVIRRNSGKRSIVTELQTDSGKVVKRLYGTFRAQNDHDLPLWIDSISLVRQPLDSLNYYKYNFQTNYRGPVRRVGKVTVSDSVAVKRPSPAKGAQFDDGMNVSPLGAPKSPSSGLMNKKSFPSMVQKKR